VTALSDGGYGFFVKEAKGEHYVNLAIARAIDVRFDEATHRMTIVAIWDGGGETYTELNTKTAADAGAVLDRITSAINGDHINRVIGRIREDISRLEDRDGA
jgi:hypothetical protein